MELIPVFNPNKDDAETLSPEAAAIELERRKAKRKHPLIWWQADKGLGRVTDAMFNELVIKRMELYRCDALDALHDLAMMPVTKNSALNNIKYLAAKDLAGRSVEVGGGKGGDLPQVMRELNEKFHKTAPRIKEVRERVITFEDEKVIQQG